MKEGVAMKKCKYVVLVCLLVLLPFVLSWPKAVGETGLAEDGLKVIILNYHKVDDTNIALSVAPQEFEKQMVYLKEAGFQTIAPDELAAYLEGQGDLPPKPVLITFDDGYADNYINAYPVLKKYGFKAVIFVITDYLDQYPAYFTWAQAKEMSQNGITIASHTMGHRSMTDLTDEELVKELEGSASAIKAHLGQDAQFVAYPTGTYNLHTADVVRKCGYRAAFTIKYGNVDKASNLYALERVPIFRTAHTFSDFIERIAYVPLFERLGWIKS